MCVEEAFSGITVELILIPILSFSSLARQNFLVNIKTLSAIDGEGSFAPRRFPSTVVKMSRGASGVAADQRICVRR